MISHTTYGKFRLRTDWKNDLIHNNHFKSSTSYHKEKYNLFFEQLNEFDLKNYKDISYLITNQRFLKKNDWSTSDREKFVYDLTSRISDPYQNQKFTLLQKINMCKINI